MAIDERMARIEGGFEQINQRMNDMNQRINDLRQDMDKRISDLQWEFRIWFGILLLVMVALRFM